MLDKALIDKLGIDMQGLTFLFGALIFTKETLQMEKGSNRLEVHKIYNYLYGFSVNRLQSIVENPFFSILILYYYINNGTQRIYKSPNMMKEAAGYKEALLNLILISPTSYMAVTKFNINLDNLKDIN